MSTRSVCFLSFLALIGTNPRQSLAQQSEPATVKNEEMDPRLQPVLDALLPWELSISTLKFNARMEFDAELALRRKLIDEPGSYFSEFDFTYAERGRIRYLSQGTVGEKLRLLTVECFDGMRGFRYQRYPQTKKATLQVLFSYPGEFLIRPLWGVCFAYENQFKWLGQMIAEGKAEWLGEYDVNGHQCVALRLSVTDTQELEVRLDPQNGFLPRQTFQPQMGVTATTEEFQRKNKLWFPAKGSYEIADADKSTFQKGRWKITSLAINEVVHDDTFDVQELEAGTIVEDRIQGQTYLVRKSMDAARVGDLWEMEVQQDANQVTLPPSLPVRKSRTLWVLSLSGVCLFVVMVAVVFMKRHHAARDLSA